MEHAMPQTYPGSRMINLLDFSDSVRILSTLSRFILQTFTVIYSWGCPSLLATNTIKVKNYRENFIESPHIIQMFCFFIWMCSQLKHIDLEILVFILVNRNDSLKDKKKFLLRYGSTHKISPYHNIDGYWFSRLPTNLKILK